jgi:hypothetical protein
MIGKGSIAFCPQVDGMQGEIFPVSPIALQSCMISKQRIAFYAQVEGMQGDILAASPITFHSRGQRIPNEPIPTEGHSWPRRQNDHLE